MATISNDSEIIFNTQVQDKVGNFIDLPISKSAPLFIVGPNGTGKSGLMHRLYVSNKDNAVRISAHRQTWMASNAVPFAPSEKIQNEQNIKNNDTTPKSRWIDYNSGARSGLVIADLIDADNAISRNARKALTDEKIKEAQKIAAKLPPLDIISNLFSESGIPINLNITDDSTIVASKNGSIEYSIASLSDGERAALLIAGTILTNLGCQLAAKMQIPFYYEIQRSAMIISAHGTGAFSNQILRLMILLKSRS